MERIAHILLLILIVAIPYLLFIRFLVIPSCKFMANRDEEARRISKEFQKSKIQSIEEKVKADEAGEKMFRVIDKPGKAKQINEKEKIQPIVINHRPPKGWSPE